ncbi:MAG: tetratricopeptide repeat protein [Planctomycetes bacterium]|nr:tetratricopeptide repeat protein [Planctomycetota bacterium]
MRHTAFAPLLLALCLAGCREEEPAPARSRWVEVQALVKAKDYDAAYRLLDAQRVPDRPDPELLLRLAEVRRLQGEPVQAVLLLREGLAADPKSRNLIAPLAGLYMHLGDSSKALEVLDDGRAQGTWDADLALLRGQALGRLERYDEAWQSYEEARAGNVKPAVIDYNRALILGKRNRHAEAVALLESVVRAEPGWPAARRELARAILDGKPAERARVEEALDLLVGAAAELPEDWRLHESIGDAWMLLQDFDAAIAAYTDALRHGQNPKSVEDRYREAVLRQRERDGATPPAPK